MKETNKIFLAFMLVPLLMSAAAAQFDYTYDDPHTVRLLATKGDNPGLIPIGDVRIWKDPDYLFIQYAITNADWRLKTTHIYVSVRSDEFSPVEGSGRLDRLEFEQAHMGETEYTYRIDNVWPSGVQFRVAAKAEVLAIQGYSSDLEGLIDSLPETVMFHAEQPSPDFLAYFYIMLQEADILDGFHHGWCVDIDRQSFRRRWHPARVFTLYDRLPPKIMEFPENMDLVNWMLNQEFIGKLSRHGDAFTWGDIQHCVWMLLEGRATNYTNGPWNIFRVQEILDAARAEGEGFIPGCNQNLLLVLVPMNQNDRVHWQSMGIVVPTPCIEIITTETAWALAWNIAWYPIGPGLSFTIR
jgi:hypothetical protein